MLSRRFGGRMAVGLSVCGLAVAVVTFSQIAQWRPALAQDRKSEPPSQEQPPAPDAQDLVALPGKENVEIAVGTGPLDPDQDAEQFVARTRKEATDKIAALDKEAAELRARLAKVIHASNRVKKAMSGMLDGELKVEVLVDGEPVLVPVNEATKIPPGPPEQSVPVKKP